jgi:uncharacterized metal-binding protein YceD (DUF177 family)
MLIERLALDGSETVVVATDKECAALAADLKVPGIRSLRGFFRLTGVPARVRVRGHVTATVTQTCVVTLDEFETDLSEAVDIEFTTAVATDVTAARREALLELEHEEPEEIVDGRIDLGHLAAEFLALGLDPYPRKPGAAFEENSTGAETGSPFAALASLSKRSD